MPIQGLTSGKPTFVELGTIRKGGAKTDANKPGPDLDYFRFVTADQEAAKAFKEVFADKPRAIEFVLPFERLEENYEAWREAYVASGLAHRCDGVTCVQWRDDKGKMQFDKKPCPTPSEAERKAGGCKQVGRLKIVIPALKRFAYITVVTTSIYDIMTMYQNLLAVELVNQGEGGLRGVPLVLRRREKEISTPAADGKRARRKKWLLSIEPTQAWVERKLLQQHNAVMGLIESVKAPLMIERGTPIEEDDEDDEIVLEGVVERAEPAIDRAKTIASIYSGFEQVRADFKVSAEAIEIRIAQAVGGQVGEFEEMEDEELTAILTSLRAWYGELSKATKKGAAK